MHWTRRRLPNILKWSAVESKREVGSCVVTSFFLVINPFVPNAPFLYFQGLVKGYIGNK